jgi:flagellar capping protein FliD
MSQIERLNRVREKIDNLGKQKERLNGELETYRRRMDEIEDECKKEFNVSIDDLPAMVQKLEDDAEKAIVEAEKILGI